VVRAAVVVVVMMTTTEVGATSTATVGVAVTSTGDPLRKVFLTEVLRHPDGVLVGVDFVFICS